MKAIYTFLMLYPIDAELYGRSIDCVQSESVDLLFCLSGLGVPIGDFPLTLGKMVGIMTIPGIVFCVFLRNPSFSADFVLKILADLEGNFSSSWRT